MRRVASWIALVALPCALACGGSSSSITPPSTGGPHPGGTSGTVTVGNDFFSPATDTVAAGTAVMWNWDTCSSDAYGGRTCASHSVTFDDGATSDIQSSGTFSRAFSTAGSFTYFCKVHGRAVMSGTIVVK